MPLSAILRNKADISRICLPSSPPVGSSSIRQKHRHKQKYQQGLYRDKIDKLLIPLENTECIADNIYHTAAPFLSALLPFHGLSTISIKAESPLRTSTV